MWYLQFRWSKERSSKFTITRSMILRSMRTEASMAWYALTDLQLIPAADEPDEDARIEWSKSTTQQVQKTCKSCAHQDDSAKSSYENLCWQNQTRLLQTNNWKQTNDLPRYCSRKRVIPKDRFSQHAESYFLRMSTSLPNFKAGGLQVFVCPRSMNNKPSF